MITQPLVSIVIPAYNEAERIVPTLKKIEEFLSKQSYQSEVIVVDDGSVDNTAQLVREFVTSLDRYQLLHSDDNSGKGGSIKKGMSSAKGRYLFFTDADLSTPIDEVNRFLAVQEKSGPFDVIIGSRRIAGADIQQQQPWRRRFSGAIFSSLVRLLVLPGFLDTQCGFKMFTSEAAARIFPKQRVMGFGFDVELLFLATKKFGFKVKEQPVQWFDSPASKVSLFRDSGRMMKDILMVRVNWIGGKYH